MGCDGVGRGERRSAWGGAEAEEEARKRRGGEERRLTWGREEEKRGTERRERGEGAGEDFFLHRLLENICNGCGTNSLCMTQIREWVFGLGTHGWR